MNVIKIKGQEVKIPHFYDAAKIQALFDSFCEPETKKDKVFNLIALADFLKLDSHADTLRDVLSLINTNMNANGSGHGVNITDELYAICQKLRIVIFAVFKKQAGESFSNFIGLYTGS